MKLELDFDRKTIKVMEDVNLQELVMQLDKMFPDERWKLFTLLTNGDLKWYYYPVYYPSSYGWSTAGSQIGPSGTLTVTDTSNLTVSNNISSWSEVTSGVYNVDTKLNEDV